MAALFRTFVLRQDAAAQGLWAFLKANWRSCAEQGKPLAVTVAHHKDRRSGRQNRLYWAVLNKIAEDGWLNGKRFSAEAWHEFFKGRFIGLEETPDGRRTGISTATLDVAEFADYMTKIEVFAASDLGIEIL